MLSEVIQEYIYVQTIPNDKKIKFPKVTYIAVELSLAVAVGNRNVCLMHLYESYWSQYTAVYVNSSRRNTLNRDFCSQPQHPAKVCCCISESGHFQRKIFWILHCITCSLKQTLVSHQWFKTTNFVSKTINLSVKNEIHNSSSFQSHFFILSRILKFYLAYISEEVH